MKGLETICQAEGMNELLKCMVKSVLKNQELIMTLEGTFPASSDFSLRQMQIPVAEETKLGETSSGRSSKNVRSRCPLTQPNLKGAPQSPGELAGGFAIITLTSF